jgi:7,8-dihydroneopterin aldolase/epimerase/oxygenase
LLQTVLIRDPQLPIQVHVQLLVNVQRSSGDTIRIEQLEILAHIGVTAEERGQSQRIVLNITVFPAVAFQNLADDINRTVNYVDICSHSRDFISSQQWNLIETLADRLASDLIKMFPLSAVEVEVRKFVLPNTAFVAATARRTKTS